MSARKPDRIVIPPGLAHLNGAIREAIEKANRAGLEGYEITEVEIGIDVEAARKWLLGPQPLTEQGIRMPQPLISYVQVKHA
jgi:hypothetical protein